MILTTFSISISRTSVSANVFGVQHAWLRLAVSQSSAVVGTVAVGTVKECTSRASVMLLVGETFDERRWDGHEKDM